ncbi:SecDF P1 head subdomain-containing protein [Pigmentiphaga aceris]|uniref:SecDF P1 head subdomain-containing protein n=1 Tax=Pigmentiphaga aceris TaxID=1940612 RepID=UPI00165260B0|nr:hypothetical protein [Pigmentiphaga aceris]
MQITQISKLAAGVALAVCAVSAHAETVSLRVQSAVVPKPEDNQPEVVNVTLDPEGQRALAAFTRNRVGQMMHLYVDGVLLTSATLHSPLTGGSLQLSPGVTGFTRASAQQIASTLSSGGALQISDEPPADNTRADGGGQQKKSSAK